jgi:hypothetical protein
MAQRTDTVTVADTATLLAPGTDTKDAHLDKRDLLLKNTGSVEVRVGGADVTWSGAKKGFPLEPGDIIQFSEIGARDLPYGVVQSGTGETTALQVGI